MARAGKVFLYLVYFAAVIVLAGVITHSLTSNKSTPTRPTTPHPAVASVPKPQPATQTPTAPAPSSGLADTGPGNVVAVFLGASLVGSAAYRQLLVARLKNQA